MESPAGYVRTASFRPSTAITRAAVSRLSSGERPRSIRLYWEREMRSSAARSACPRPRLESGHPDVRCEPSEDLPRVRGPHIDLPFARSHVERMNGVA